MKSHRERMQFYAAECCETQQDYAEMMAEIASYDDDRCEEECTKIEAFKGFAETLKSQMAQAPAGTDVADLPIVQAESKATDLVISGNNSHSKH